MISALTPRMNRIVNFIVCIGASIVIVGALFKIQHWKGADVFLPVGLLVEAGIFFLYALLPPPESHAGEKTATTDTNPLLQSMEKMLHDSDLTPTVLSKLSTSFQKLGTTVDKIGDISDAVAATNEYTRKTNEASQSLSTIKTAYDASANAMLSLAKVSDSTQIFHEQVQVLTKNLSSLNTVYELELQESNNHLKSMNKFYGKLAEASSVMEGSADDALKAKQQITALAGNLQKLNQVYGNMLTAMNTK